MITRYASESRGIGRAMETLRPLLPQVRIEGECKGTLLHLLPDACPLGYSWLLKGKILVNRTCGVGYTRMA